MSVIYQASLETEHFDFEAYGSTPVLAKLALRNGVELHCKRCQVPKDDFIRAYWGEVVLREIKLGVAYCDRQAMS